MMTAGFASSGVTVSVPSPASGATLPSPVAFVAKATSSKKITAMAIYVDSAKVYSTASASLGTSIVMSAGQHTVVVQAENSAGQTSSDTMTLQVSTLTPPPQAAGYSLAFSDNFTPLNLSPNGEGDYTWYQGLWWNTGTSPSSDISSTKSSLTLNWENGQGTSDTDVSACSPNGLYCHAFRYGYFEASMLWDPTTGSWPAFWMLPVQDITGLGSADESGEIDIFEGQGATPNTYFGTIHDWKNGVDIANNESTNAYPLASTVNLTQYHTYGVLWVPGTITWYFDNQPLYSAATYPIFDQQNFYPILSSQEGVDWTYGDMSGVTASSIPLNVAWIHVWQN